MSRGYGRGSVYRRKSDGLWVGAATVAGKRHHLYGPSRSAVQGKLDDLLASARLGIAPTDDRLTVGRQLATWLVSVRPSVRPSTWVSYEGHVRLHLAGLAAISLARLTPADVRVWVQDRLDDGCAPRTAAYSLTVLRMAIKQAIRDGLVQRNAAALATAPSAPREELRILTLAEAQRLMAVESPLAPLWTLLLGTGLRLGEALGLRWSDVDLNARTLTVRVALRPMPRSARPDAPTWSRTGQRLQLVEPKTSAARRTVGLPVFVRDVLLAQRAAQDQLPRNILGLIFTTPRGTPLDPRNVSRAFAQDLQSAGLRHMRIHDLRHACVSMMLSQGASLDDVKRVIGHTSIALTSDTYGHLVEGRSREVADGLDRLIC